MYVYYFYDMRPEGLPDKALGKNRDEAIAQWEELHLGRPRIRGRLREAIQRWLREELPTYDYSGTRRNYKMHLKRVDAVLGIMTWDQVTLIVIKQYLKDRRNTKDPNKPALVQANWEMAALQIVWNWARQMAREGSSEAYTTLPWPAAGMERSGWKNPEQAVRSSCGCRCSRPSAPRPASSSGTLWTCPRPPACACTTASRCCSPRATSCRSRRARDQHQVVGVVPAAAIDEARQYLRQGDVVIGLLA